IMSTSSHLHPLSLPDALPISLVSLPAPAVSILVVLDPTSRPQGRSDHDTDPEDVSILVVLDPTSRPFHSVLIARQPMSFNPCCADRKSTRLNSSHGSISYAVF